MKEASGSTGVLRDSTALAPGWWRWLLLSDGRLLVDATSVKQLHRDDLLPLESPDTVAACLSTVQATGFRFEQASTAQILAALGRAYGRTLASCVAGHIFTAASATIAPLVVRHVVLAFQDTTTVDTAALAAWITAFFAMRFVAVLVDTHVFHALNHVRLRLVNTWRSLLFRKAMRCQMHAETSELSNLATIDAASSVAAVPALVKLCVVPLHIAVVIYLLYTVLGVAAFPGIAVIVLSLVVNYRIARFIGTAYATVMRLKDDRTRTVTEAFSAMEHVKFNGWERWFETKILTQRDRELQQLKRYVYAAAASSCVLLGAPLAVSTLSFAVYTLVLGQELTAATAFTSVVLFNVLRKPLEDLPAIVQYLFHARVSIDRIARYLQTPERSPTNIQRIPVASSPFAIQMQEATFGWDTFVLSNLSLEIQRGDFVVVSGALGAGKSALCLALLGELERRAGSASIAGAVAYVSQTPWIQHMTIRDNILFGLEFDAQRYAQILHACCLDDDLSFLPAGDSTEIGERGVNLSGGQKMRIALARACYADADVYVLDAVLAPLDVAVQRKVVQRCLSALFVTKTVILTTHEPEWLMDLGIVNFQIHLDHGRATVGTRRDASTCPIMEPSGPAAVASTPVQVNKTSVFVGEEETAVGDVSARVWSHYVHAIGGVRTVLLLVATQLLWQGFQVRSDLWLSAATSNHVPPSRLVAVYALLTSGTVVMVVVRGLVVSHVGLRASATLFYSMVRGLLSAPMSFFDPTPLGRILNRFVDDMTVVDLSIPKSFGHFLTAAVATASALFTASAAIGWCGLLLVPITVVYVTIAQQCVRACCELMRLRKVMLAPVLSHLSHGPRGVATLRAFGDAAVARAIRAFEERVDGNSRLWHSEIVLHQWFFQRLEWFGCMVLAVVFGSVVMFHDRFSPGSAGMVLTYALSVNSALMTLVRMWTRSQNAMVSVERVLAYSHLKREDAQTKQAALLPTPWPSLGKIEFQDVDFGYAPHDVVLRNVSFQVRGGETIGIMGRTGAGKSSLVMALVHRNELAGGSILIDGVDIATVPLAHLRRAIAIIPQSPVLLEGAVRAFLDPDSVFQDSVLLDVLERVQLAPALRRLGPHILDIGLRVEGENLSVGQRQLLCMARVLVRNPSIVVFDEATAAVDKATERSLTETLRRELSGVTRLTIAHRFASVENADRILVLHDGRVVAFETPETLVATGHDLTMP